MQQLANKRHGVIESGRYNWKVTQLVSPVLCIVYNFTVMHRAQWESTHGWFRGKVEALPLSLAIVSGYHTGGGTRNGQWIGGELVDWLMDAG